MFTRPTLDLYLVNRYWNFLTSDLSTEEVADLDKARSQLAHYEKIYSIMEYGCDLNGLLTVLDTRMSANNPSLPQTIYKQSRHNNSENIFNEVELCLDAYYGVIDDCKEFPEWQKKVEEDIGQNLAYTFINFDESVRDILVNKSQLFNRFDLEKQKFFK